jgi:S-adenosylmethionine/arginine decarboxylase-like enzyme
MLEHKHFILKGKLDFNEGAFSVDTVHKWLLDLVQLLDMKLLIEPQVVYCTEPQNEGVTGLCAITTSSITFHSWVDGMLQLDVYSCKDFDPVKVMHHTEKLGTVIDYSFIVLDRNNKIEVLEQV